MPVEATPFKRALKWKAIPVRDIRGNGTNFVPFIVEREEAATLEELVYNAIDTGRIAGVKPSAAGSIADALCEMIGATLNSGRGVKFGPYFYVRLYLTGTLDPANPVLTDDNQIRTRLIAGSGLRLNRTDFDWESTEIGDAPNVEKLLADVTDAVDGEIVRGSGINLVGSNLKITGASTAVLSWGEGDDATSVTLGTPTVNGDELVKFAWPTALAEVAAGTKIVLTLTYKDSDGTLVSTINVPATLVVRA